MTRKIIHIDMDAFYASVEELRDPSLIGKPVIVGGSPQSRGVVCTANYIARKFGVKSAMSCSQAYRLCPEGIFIRPRFEHYVEISKKIREIFFRYTDLVEPLSLDEAYLDVTENKHGLYAVQIARKIKEEIKQEIGLSCSAGVASNKLIAKIASDSQKPNGLVVVTPEQTLTFLRPLSVRKIHGVGPATAARLAELKIFKCEDIDLYTKEELTKILGSHGEWIWNCAQGIDHRPVVTSRIRKSIGRETTFAKDTSDHTKLQAYLLELAEDVAQALLKKKLGGRTLTLKIKYANFDRITRCSSLESPTQDKQVIYELGLQLLQEKTDVTTRPVRLIGVSLSKLETLDQSAKPQ